jgi:hypothetical protein
MCNFILLPSTVRIITLRYELDIDTQKGFNLENKRDWMCE